MVSKLLVERIAEHAKDVKEVDWDSMNTIRVKGDYKRQGDGLGVLVPGVVEGFYDKGGILLPQGVAIGTVTKGTFWEVADPFAAITERKFAKEASIDYSVLEGPHPRTINVDGIEYTIQTYQSTQKLTGEARERADSGLLVGISEAGALGHTFQDGRYTEWHFANAEIPEAIKNIREDLSKNSEMDRYMPFITEEYRLNLVFTVPRATSDDLKFIAEKVYESAQRIAPGLFGKPVQNLGNERVYLVPAFLINGAICDKFPGSRFLQQINGRPVGIKETGYGADGVTEPGEIGMILQEGITAAYALDVDPRMDQFGKYSPPVPGKLPAVGTVNNGRDALLLTKDAYELRAA